MIKGNVYKLIDGRGAKYGIWLGNGAFLICRKELGTYALNILKCGCVVEDEELDLGPCPVAGPFEEWLLNPLGVRNYLMSLEEGNK